MPDDSYDFRPLEGIARTLRFLLLLGAIVSLVAALSDLIEIQLLSRVAAGEELSDVETAANDTRQGLVAVVQLLALLATTVAFLTWFYRSHKNLTALGATDVKYSSGWAIGGFFVPIMALYRPFQIMKEVWRGSKPEESMTVPGLQPFAQPAREETPSIVSWWWGLFLISTFLGQFSLRLMFRAEQTVGVLQVSAWTTFGSDVTDVAGLLVTAALVQRVTSRQADQWNRMMIFSPPVPANPEPVKPFRS